MSSPGERPSLSCRLAMPALGDRATRFCQALRRQVLAQGLVLALGLGSLAGTSSPLAVQPSSTGIVSHGQSVPISPDRDLVRYVNPLAGTDAGQPNFGTGGGGANLFPGATMPFGMVQWSPDTTPSTINVAGGYTYRDRAIHGFSLTHISGAGCPVYQDIAFMPTVKPVTRSSDLVNKYSVSAPFTHRTEQATPGFYTVQVGARESAIRVALTTTPRTGIGLFTYPATQHAVMIVNAGASALGTTRSSIQIVGPRVVTGSATSGGFCGVATSYTVYFAAVFSQPFSSLGAWAGASVIPGSRASTGRQTGAYVTFDTRHTRAVLVKVGLSFVSVANAWANLHTEDPGTYPTVAAFAAIRQAASAAWNHLLNRIQVDGGTDADRRTFYTMLYHTLLFPSIFSDANGQYIGFDKQIHRAVVSTAQGSSWSYVQYANFSGWDIYRSEMPLLALLVPDRTSDMMQSLVADAEQGGWLPRWALANSETGVMIGDPALPIIASAYALGARHFDTQAALRYMLKEATDGDTGSGNLPGLAAYRTYGYVPEGTVGVWGSLATTLEYATADFALAQFARAISPSASTPSDAALSATFLRRAQNWRNLYNPATGYLQPRLATGAFSRPFRPTTLSVEGDAAQYTWMVPFNLRGLFTAMGGVQQAVRRLDAFFLQLNAGPTALSAYLGNEPTLEVPWEYDFLGQPGQTQAIVRRAILDLYSATPGGYPGNDDLGQMSSWYIFGALGFYPEIPGTSVLVLGSPLFPRVTLHLAGGTVLIHAASATRSSMYVQRLTVNGRPYDKPWLLASVLTGGGSLDFTLGSMPNPQWGSTLAAAPPSFSR